MKARSKNVGVLRTGKNAIDAIDAIDTKETPAGNIRFRELISSTLVNPVARYQKIPKQIDQRSNGQTFFGIREILHDCP